MFHSGSLRLKPQANHQCVAFKHKDNKVTAQFQFQTFFHAFLLMKNLINKLKLDPQAFVSACPQTLCLSDSSTSFCPKSKVSTSSRRLSVVQTKKLHIPSTNTYTKRSSKFDHGSISHQHMKNIQSHSSKKREEQGGKRQIKEHNLNADLLCSLGWQCSHMLLTESTQVQLPPPSTLTGPPPSPLPLSPPLQPTVRIA